MNIDESILKKKQKALESYHKELKKWNNKENQVKWLLWNTLKDRMRTFFKGCGVYGADDLYDFYNYLMLRLNEDYNLTDFMLFLEENEPLISLVCGGIEFEHKHDMIDKKYVYKYPKFNLEVYYGNGKCHRVKVSEKTVTIKEPIYEVVCD